MNTTDERFRFSNKCATLTTKARDLVLSRTSVMNALNDALPTYTHHEVNKMITARKVNMMTLTLIGLHLRIDREELIENPEILQS